MSTGLKQIKALQAWCQRATHGYSGVHVKDMSRSWKDGLAFCALIHHFRPDLINFESLSKENVAENNKLAFDVAERELDIPALLDPEDMVIMEVPDKLCIVTYVAQFYNHFNKQKGSPVVSPKSKHKFAHVLHKAVKPPKSPTKLDGATTPTKRPFAISGLNKDGGSSPLASPQGEQPSSAKRLSMSDVCTACHKKVYLLERHIVEGRLYHRACFKCLRCNATLRPGSYRERSEEGGGYECLKHQHEQNAEPMDTAAPAAAAPPSDQTGKRPDTIDISRFMSPQSYQGAALDEASRVDSPGTVSETSSSSPSTPGVGPAPPADSPPAAADPASREQHRAAVDRILAAVAERRGGDESAGGAGVAGGGARAGEEKRAGGGERAGATGEGEQAEGGKRAGAGAGEGLAFHAVRGGATAAPAFRPIVFESKPVKSFARLEEEEGRGTTRGRKEEEGEESGSHAREREAAARKRNLSVISERSEADASATTHAAAEEEEEEGVATATAPQPPSVSARMQAIIDEPSSCSLQKMAPLKIPVLRKVALSPAVAVATETAESKPSLPNKETPVQSGRPLVAEQSGRPLSAVQKRSLFFENLSGKSYPPGGATRREAADAANVGAAAKRVGGATAAAANSRFYDGARDADAAPPGGAAAAVARAPSSRFYELREGEEEEEEEERSVEARVATRDFYDVRGRAVAWRNDERAGADMRRCRASRHDDERSVAARHVTRESSDDVAVAAGNAAAAASSRFYDATRDGDDAERVTTSRQHSNTSRFYDSEEEEGERGGGGAGASVFYDAESSLPPATCSAHSNDGDAPSAAPPAGDGKEASSADSAAVAPPRGGTAAVLPPGGDAAGGIYGVAMYTGSDVVPTPPSRRKSPRAPPGGEAAAPADEHVAPPAVQKRHAPMAPPRPPSDLQRPVPKPRSPNPTGGFPAQRAFNPFAEDMSDDEGGETAAPSAGNPFGDADDEEVGEAAAAPPRGVATKLGNPFGEEEEEEEVAATRLGSSEVARGQLEVRSAEGTPAEVRRGHHQREVRSAEGTPEGTPEVRKRRPAPTPPQIRARTSLPPGGGPRPASAVPVAGVLPAKPVAPPRPASVSGGAPRRSPPPLPHHPPKLRAPRVPRAVVEVAPSRSPVAPPKPQRTFVQVSRVAPPARKPMEPPPPPPPPGTTKQKRIHAEGFSPLGSPETERAEWGGENGGTRRGEEEEEREEEEQEEQGKTLKRHAPKPPTFRRKITKERINPQDIKLELLQLDMQQTELERKGAEVEQKLRHWDTDSDNTLDMSAHSDIDDDDEGLVEWFELVNTKNRLLRRENELVYMQRQQELEDRHEEVEFQLRRLMEKPEGVQTADDRKLEEALLAELVDIVTSRNQIVETIDADRIREEEEDRSISEMMLKQGMRKAEVEEDTGKKGKKKKKEKKDKKKHKH